MAFMCLQSVYLLHLLSLIHNLHHHEDVATHAAFVQERFSQTSAPLLCAAL